MSEVQPDGAKTNITVDDLLTFEAVTDAQLHPDGGLVAFVVASTTTEPRSSRPRSRVWLAGDEQPPTPISADGTIASCPRWSPDGSALAFLSARNDDDPSQLHLLSAGWGESSRVTECRGGVSDVIWSPDAQTIALLVTDAVAEDVEDKQSGRDHLVYEERHCFTRIWLYEVATGSLTQAVDDDLHVWEAAWSPDSNALVAIVSDEPYNWGWYGARVARVSLATRSLKTVRAAKKQVTFPSWSPNGATIAAIYCTWSDQGMTGGDVLLIDHDGGQERLLTEGHPRSYLNAEWEADGLRLLCAAIEDGEAVIGFLAHDGSFNVVWRERASLLRWGGRPFTRDASGERIAVVRGTPEEAPQVWTLDISRGREGWTRHTDMNATIRERTVAPVQTLRWQSPDGESIQGLLVRPRDTVAGPLPLITLVHGGPTSIWSYDFMTARSMGWIQLLAAEGYAVLLPNPRGSIGWGTRFAEANIGDMGGGDLADVLAGVDYCVEQGMADGNRLGIGGWSYGGYMTAWAVTQTGRFRAAVAGASITNWISFHGVSTIPGFDQEFYPVDPYEWDGHYGQFSPMAHVRRVETPTLFLHGERDPICPLGQAHEMWRALKERRVDTRLVVYPREGHGIREREHARDVLERAVGWFKQYV